MYCFLCHLNFKKQTHFSRNAKFYSSTSIKWWLLTNGNECPQMRHGTISLAYTRWDRGQALGPMALTLRDCAVCSVHCVSAPLFPFQASSQVQGLLTTNAASEQSSKYSEDLELQGWGSESQAAAPSIHRLLNQAHRDTKHCSLGTADILGQGKPYKLQGVSFSQWSAWGERGWVPSDSVITFISWIRPFMSAFQLKANVCGHVQRQRNKSNVEQFPRP